MEDGRCGMPVGFIHPITNQLYLWQTAHHERKEMCDVLHKYSHNDAFRWKVQSVMQLSLLVVEHLDLVDMKAVLSELSREDRDMYMKNSISQPVARDDDDVEMKKIYKNNSGYKDIYTFDANKHYSSVLKFRKHPYLVATMWDTWKEFDVGLHGDIPYGERLLKRGHYRSSGTNLLFNHNIYTYTVIR
jgi:hypothetical protein